ncbi:hypothetical protein DEU56DRAFT_903599 [Suillus clintonianus]|uniref:uncharacterized protein n=1 Tax=Suillus clintonianus TaxID=1904413 RepID=UPI001B860AEF|nr:uncharacterized protein DEU56DRAFT_903599 [Suillus clintonianus]KAG2125813.1 hypothetical protein DEU56DRAFT_903599 [Suillus clintonianus]
MQRSNPFRGDSDVGNSSSMCLPSASWALYSGLTDPGWTGGMIVGETSLKMCFEILSPESVVWAADLALSVLILRTAGIGAVSIASPVWFCLATWLVLAANVFHVSGPG